MSDELLLEDRLRELGEAMSPDHSFAEVVMERVERQPATVAEPPVRRTRFGTSISARRSVLLASALAALMFLAWSIGGDDGHWWGGSHAAYAQEISRVVEQARVKGVVARSRTQFVMQDGTRHVSSTVSNYFIRNDRYRLDIFDNGELREIQWYVPQGAELVQTSLLVGDGSTKVDRHANRRSDSDPISQFLEVAKRFDQAQRKFGPEVFEGKRCIGFEIDAKPLDADNDAAVYRIWVDVDSKRPVRLEIELPASTPQILTMTLIFDQFEWNPRLPADTFTPHLLSDVGKE